MKKLLRTLFILLLLGLGFLYIVKNPELPISQKILSTFNIDLTTETPVEEIDLTDCLVYFDGCNTCGVEDGELQQCTEMYCETLAQPQCLEYERTGMDLSDCISYFDGCNTCTVENGRPSACTLMYCETPAEPYCIEYATGEIDEEIEASIQENTSLFLDEDLGIKFIIPDGRSKITKEKIKNNQTIYLITLSHNGTSFLAAHNGIFATPRGGFRGDQAQNIHNADYIKNFCKGYGMINCTLLTNTHGIPYVKYYQNYVDEGITKQKTRLMYFIFNPKSLFRGIILSNNTTSPEREKYLDTIVQEIQFFPANQPTPLLINHGYITEAYTSGTKLFLKIDYVAFGDMGPSGAPEIINNNPLIRTFEIDSNAIFTLLKYDQGGQEPQIISWKEFQTWANSDRQTLNPDAYNPIYYGNGKSSLVEIINSATVIYSVQEIYRP